MDEIVIEWMKSFVHDLMSHQGYILGHRLRFTARVLTPRYGFMSEHSSFEIWSHECTAVSKCYLIVSEEKLVSVLRYR